LLPVLLLLLHVAAHGAIDGMEHLFGATNMNAVTGTGGLTAGFSACGELVLLRFPNPSYFDQLRYLTMNGPDAREQPRFGALEGMGAFAGIWYRPVNGERRFKWLRDPSVYAHQRYDSDENGIIVTCFNDRESGLAIEQKTFVVPGRNLLVFRYEAAIPDCDPLLELGLTFYAAPAPCLLQIPYYPIYDWGADPWNGYAVLHDRRTGVTISYYPRAALRGLAGPPDFSNINSLLAEEHEDLGAAVERFIDESMIRDDGIYLLWGALPPDQNPDSYQCGFDTGDICGQLDRILDNVDPEMFGIDPSLLDMFHCEDPLAEVRAAEGWIHEAEDAYLDAADVELSGSPVSAFLSNLALSYSMDLSPAFPSLTIVMAAGTSYEEAAAELAWARDVGYEALESAARDDWAAWLAQARVPPGCEGDCRAFFLRTLMTARTYTDAEAGAIVASVSTQPPYAQDWPRDGAFINLMLDLAGYTEMVTRHNLFYAEVQRLEDSEAAGAPADPEDPDRHVYPGGAWEMNYYSNGIPGGFLRFEIDNTGLAVWTLANHARFIDDPSARREYLDAVYPAIARAADLLVRWRDPATGLPAPASEDDNPGYTQGVQSAVTTYLALDWAIWSGELMGESQERLERWRARRDELREAVFTHLWSPDARMFRRAPGSEQLSWSGPSSWALYPAELFRDRGGDLAVARYCWEDIAPTLHKETEGGSYVGKITLADALTWSHLPDRRPTLLDTLRIMTTELPTPDTRHQGEVFLVLDDDGERRFENRVAIPHLWAATLTNLTISAVLEPTRFPRLHDRPPVILAAGFGATRLQTGNPGALTLLAWVTDPDGPEDIAAVELLYQDQPTGLTLHDDGLLGDRTPGDGVFTLALDLPQLPPVPAPLEFSLRARDHDGAEATSRLHITEE
jgi:hypothetical protein